MITEPFDKISYNDVFLFLIFIVIVLFWYYGTRNYNYWEKHKVFSNKPVVPFLGNLKLTDLRKSNLVIIQKLYDSINSQPYGGIYVFNSPALLVKDPDLITKILITDFNSFTSRGFTSNFQNDPLAKNILHLNNSKNWKFLRPKFQAAFGPSKLKHMSVEMDNIAKNVLKVFDESGVKQFESCSLSARYMVDVTYSTGFGIESNTVIDKNYKENEFYHSAIQIFIDSHFLIHVAVGFLYTIFHKIFKLNVASKLVTDFFTKISKEIVSLRQNSGTFRKDFLDCLIQFSKQKDLINALADKTDTISNMNTNKLDLTNGHSNSVESNEDVGFDNGELPLVFDQDFIAANVFMVFAAGFDSSAKICSYSLFELAANQEIQNMAREEVLRVMKLYDGNVSYEAVQKMTYLEQIVSESNRKYPILSAVFRRCTKRYVMPDGGIIEAGIPVIIPSSAIHYNPKYYPNPEKFDPERFNEENKHKIHPSTYLSFGIGPRMCLAMQFAMVEVKIAVARILSEYQLNLDPSNNTYPLKLHPRMFLLSPLNEIYINIKKI